MSIILEEGKIFYKWQSAEWPRPHHIFHQRFYGLKDGVVLLGYEDYGLTRSLNRCIEMFVRRWRREHHAAYLIDPNSFVRFLSQRMHQGLIPFCDVVGGHSAIVNFGGLSGRVELKFLAPTDPRLCNFYKLQQQLEQKRLARKCNLPKPR